MVDLGYVLYVLHDRIMADGEVRRGEPGFYQGVQTRLREKRQDVWNQSREIAQRVYDEHRQFTWTENETWNRLLSELSELDWRIRRITEIGP